MPVASIGHLIALKTLAARHQDLTDLGYLISVATDADLDEARASAAMIEERGFNRVSAYPKTWPPSSAKLRSNLGISKGIANYNFPPHLPNGRK